MLFYLTLLILSGIITLTGIVSIVIGLIKKHVKFRSIGLFVFVVGILGCFIFSYKYAKATLEYVQSGDFQDDAKKTSQFVGETAGSIVSGVSQGLALGLDDSAIANLAQKSGVIIGNSIKTLASGLDSTIGDKNIFIDKMLETEGLSFGRAEEKFNSQSNDLGIYVASKSDFNGKIRITNYDQTGKIIDTAERKVSLKAGKGNVEIFSFKNSNFGITTYFIISKATE